MNELPFTVLFEALKHNYDTYLNNIWANLGFLLLCIGWFITSKRKQHLQKKTNIILLATLIFAFVSHVIVLCHYLNKSNEILYLIKLDDIGKTLVQNVEYFKIKGHYVAFSLLSTGILYIVLGWFLLKNKGE